MPASKFELNVHRIHRVPTQAPAANRKSAELAAAYEDGKSPYGVPLWGRRGAEETATAGDGDRVQHPLARAPQACLGPRLRGPKRPAVESPRAVETLAAYSRCGEAEMD
ncbi:unnamed protein product [Parajaminaea phylloscopi]